MTNYGLMKVKSIAECSIHGEHSAILLTFINLPFAIKTFVLSFLSDCLRQVILYLFQQQHTDQVTQQLADDVKEMCSSLETKMDTVIDNINSLKGS